jgi:anti-anti-sigma factor
MALDIDIADGLSIVRLPERLDGTAASQAEGEFAALLEAGLPVVFDARRCAYISSAGLRLLLVVAKRLVPAGCSVVIAGMAEGPADIMRITGFDHMFAFHPTLEAAISALKPGS